MNLKDKYNIEESSTSITVQPFNYYKKSLWWQVLGLLISAGASIYFLMSHRETGSIISFALAIIFFFPLLNEIFFIIPNKYTFDASQNAVFKSNLFSNKKRIIDLDKIVIFVSDNNNGWSYHIGEKKKQFIKSYQISEYFGDGKKSERKASLYETQILSKINDLIPQK